MKKLIAIIFLVTYFVTSSGATMRLHYCMDKLVDWSFFNKVKANCSSCGMEKKGHKGCCHDENRIIKVDKNHKASTTSFEFLKYFPLINNTFLVNEHFFPFNPVTTNPSTNAPPVRAIPIYLYISVFRI